MDSIDNAIMRALNVNMGYKEGENVAIVAQRWSEELGKDKKKEMERSYKVATRMRDVFMSNGIDVNFVEYTPEIADHNKPVTQEVYDRIGSPDVIFMPTAYSLTRSEFASKYSKMGARIASMPLFTMKMFEKGGPMDADYNEIHMRTKELAGKLRKSNYVKIEGEGTEMVVEIDPKWVVVSSGLMTKEVLEEERKEGLHEDKGCCRNLPGAEAYAVPKVDSSTLKGGSNGYFTVKAGWGGSNQLKHDVTFYVKDGRYVDFKGKTKEAQEYIDKEIRPHFAEEGFDLLAELGIGTNRNITPEYIKKHGWNLLLIEKITSDKEDEYVVHFANGNDKPRGLNPVKKHIDWVVPGVNLKFGYKPKSDDGYIPEMHGCPDGFNGSLPSKPR